MRRLLGLAVLIIAATAPASAGLIYSVNETFASGATFNGLVTFADDYLTLEAVDGWLTGGSYGNDHFTWIWDNYNRAATFGPYYGNNYLMNGTDHSHYSRWVTITWDFSAAPHLVLASPGRVFSSDGGNNVNYADELVSGSITSIPEPATAALVIPALAAFALLRRRK